MFFALRCSRPEVFYKKGVLRNFAKFTGKHLCQNLVFNKVIGPRPATLLKKRLLNRCFPVNFAKFLRALSYRTPLGTVALVNIFCLLYKYRSSLPDTVAHNCQGNNKKKHC